MNNGELAARLLVGFVEKCGGIEKMRALDEALRGVRDRDGAIDYVRRAVRTNAGARQVFACMLAGVSLATHLHGPLTRDIAAEESDA